MCVTCPIGRALPGSIIFLLVFFAVGSSTRSVIFFLLGQIFLWNSLLSYFPSVLFGFLSCSRRRFRVLSLRSIELFFRFFSVTQLLFLLSFVDSLCGVSQLSTILVCPCHMLFGTHMLSVLARLSCCLLFLCCDIMHVSVFIASVMVLLRRAGGIGWLGDISQQFAS